MPLTGGVAEVQVPEVRVEEPENEQESPEASPVTLDSPTMVKSAE